MSNIIEYDTLGSTNREAKRLGLAGAEHETTIIAAEQTEGRGRLGRSWFSPRGGLWMSVIVRFQLEQGGSVPRAIDPSISLAAGVAVAEALTDIFVELGRPDVNVRIGWPNDILVDGRKIAGVLVEGCVIENNSPFAVAGFGINLNNKACSLPGELRNAAMSVKDIVNTEYPVRKACEQLAVIFMKTINHIQQNGMDDVLDKWRARSAAIGREVTVIPHGEPPYDAIPLDIDSKGRLEVRMISGETRLLDAEEVTIARNSNREGIK